MIGNQKDYDGDGDTISFYDKMNHDVPTYHKSHDKVVEEYIHKNFNRLSVDDRTEIAQEIDGTSCMAVAETLELLECSLAKLKIELDSGWNLSLHLYSFLFFRVRFSYRLDLAVSLEQVALLVCSPPPQSVVVTATSFLSFGPRTPSLGSSW